MTPTLSRLYNLLDPLALSTYLDKALAGLPANCDQSYRFTRAFLSIYAPDSDEEEVLRLLRELGGGCDCEVLLNVAPQVLAAEDEEDQSARYFGADA